ncbi:hypothetical protein FACS18942_09190 [Planctomycetales bacterium]|nr:hypothetical protein FACS18942_09190 [Planctomycetales bacterium]GHT35510.1 hypothetical protein FACS189427_04960 [Planctomycetales bacterium]
MKKTLLNLTAVCIAMLCYTGCSHEEHHHDGDGHNHAPATQAEHHHEGDGHDHGNASATDDETERSGHSHKVGRHKGRIAVLGGHSCHAELIAVNPETGEVVFEITDRSAKTPAVVEAKELTLTAVIDKKSQEFTLPRETAEREKGYTTFALKDAALAKLLHTGNWDGDVIVILDEKGVNKEGKLYKGQLDDRHEHHDHDGHDH